MMPLIPTNLVYGYATALERAPRVEIHEDVLYVPLNSNGWTPGIYDRGRKLVMAACDFRTQPEMRPIHESFVCNLNPDDILEVIEEPLIYGCHFITHYGHYLLSCLSRYWATRSLRQNDERILYLHQEPADIFWRHHYIRDTLECLGLSASSFVGFDRPVRIARLVVPAPSFEENNVAYRVFATFCNGIGDSLVAGMESTKSGVPVYLSKSRIKQGICRIENEIEFEIALEKRGVEIHYPETLGLKEQILLFRTHPLISGGMGSAMHTSVFSPAVNLVILNHEPSVMSNQPLIDAVNRNVTQYLYPYADIDRLERSEDFHVNYRLRDPVAQADQFLRAIDSAMSAGERKIHAI